MSVWWLPTSYGMADVSRPGSSSLTRRRTQQQGPQHFSSAAMRPRLEAAEPRSLILFRASTVARLYPVANFLV